MSLPNGQPAWPLPVLQNPNNFRSNSQIDDRSARNESIPIALVPEASTDAEDDARRAIFTNLFKETDDRIGMIYGDNGVFDLDAIRSLRRLQSPGASSTPVVIPPATDHEPIKEPPLKKAKRAIDEDDYDDDDDEEVTAPASKPPQQSQNLAAGSLPSPSKSGSSPVHSAHSPARQQPDKPNGQESSQKPGDDGIKSLEDARIATEQAARRSFHTMFYTLENDHAAMIEQRQLEDSEKQLQAELDHNGSSAAAGQQTNNQGSLSNANLGASSLTLKHLIARIDAKREQVNASDAELRLLMKEVRKNRSKWASEENVNQEELYEAFDKVLTELKAHTEYSTPFLKQVNKRDAPDYYNFIKNPMDLGTMFKKLKTTIYKSKTEFVTDLNLIWDNCLKYNQDVNHPLRRMANGMRREAEKLIPLIPDLTIRSRAEVEAEERRKLNGGEDDGGEDSDDEPIMSSRGRKTGTKGATKSRKAPSDQKEETPAVDQKPVIQVNGLLGKHGREDSEAVDGSIGFSTPPIGGSHTPAPTSGQSGVGSGEDNMDVESSALGGIALNEAFQEAVEQAYEDEEYKVWKQTTKKDRALAAKERHALFANNKLDVEAGAALRTKAAMRRFLNHQLEAESHKAGADKESDASEAAKEAANKPSETLAEGIDEEPDRVLPDYYDALSNIPDIHPKFQWIEDGEGHVINQHEGFLRAIPAGSFISPQSRLAKKIDNNIRQIQETRKLSSKISIIKQMQVQTQVYANQFPKSNSEPFIEQDIEPTFISDTGPIMAADASQDALKRSITKILYHAGFEEAQPSAVDAFTGVVEDYYQKLVKTFSIYQDAEKKAVQTPTGVVLQSRFTPEEVILHTLDETGHDIVSLDSYMKEDLDRHSSKLGTLHDRMKMHLTDLLRPALTADAGTDGVGAFKDGADTFVSGDFADDLGEDFFGFRALGLEGELGGALGVPFHLLQSRVRNQYQMQTQTNSAAAASQFDALEPLEAVTRENIGEHIGLVKNFFLAKLHANGDQPLVEDEDLPVKQRKPRPRLGASGKIVSAQKRPPREQIALAKKKKKMEAAAAEARLNGNPSKGATGASTAAASASANETPSKKKSVSLPNGTAPNPAVLAISMERRDSTQSQGANSQADDKDEAVSMMSPESIAP